MEGLAQGEGEIGAQAQVAVHDRAAQVEIAIAQADVLSRVGGVVDRERRGHGRVEHRDARGQDLDLARGHVLVGLALDAVADRTGHEDRPLGTDGLGGREGLARQIGVENHLRHALAVADGHEDELAQVAAVVDPAGQPDFLAGIGCAQLAAGVGVHGMKCHLSSPLVSGTPWRVPLCRRRRPVDRGAAHSFPS